MLRPLSLYTFAFAALALGAATAGAQQAATPLEPGSFYVTFDGGPRYLEVPEVTALFGFSGPLEGIDDSEWGWGIEAGLGYVLAPDLQVLGENTRIELSPSLVMASGKSFELTPGGLGAYYVDGSGYWGYSSSIEGATSKFEYRQVGVDLLLRTDLDENDSARISLFGGFTFTHTDQRHEFWIAQGNLVTEDDVDAEYYGLALGADLVLPLGAGFALAVGGRADLMGVDADLEARQPAVGLEVNDGDTDFAARLGGTLGISRQLGPVVIGVEGYGNWLSYAPQAVHPVGPADPASHIDGDDAWQVGGGLRATVPFGADWYDW